MARLKRKTASRAPSPQLSAKLFSTTGPSVAWVYPLLSPDSPFSSPLRRVKMRGT